MTYPALNAQIVQHFQAQQYAEAHALATQGLTQYPDQVPNLVYWQLVTAARQDDAALVCRLLAERLQAGLWFGEMLLRDSPSFKPLQGHPEFERLIAQSQALAQNEKPAPLIILTPTTPAPWPLLFALHGNSSSAALTRPFWEDAVNAGWCVALPQSPHLFWTGAYLWRAHAHTQTEVLPHLAAVQQQYSIDPQRIVIAGHSMGGAAAIWLALTAAVAVRGFIGLGPGGDFVDEPDTWAAVLANAHARKLRGALIIGDQDTDISLDHNRTLADQLNSAGIPCALELVPAAQHGFHPNYVPALHRALAFVMA